MKIALIIAFHKQYAEWSKIIHALRNQTVKADKVIVALDSMDISPAFDQSDNIHVSRHDLHPNAYSRGIAINNAIQEHCRDIDIIVTIDADCTFPKNFIETYRDIYSGKLNKWSYVGWKMGASIHCQVYVDSVFISKDQMKKVFVGPRYFIPEIKLIPEAVDTYDQLKMLSNCSRIGHRGFENGTAAIMGCNMAFPKWIWDEVKFRENRKEDSRWWKEVQKKFPEVKSAPAPDSNNVLHFGTNGVGQYW
ncbi:MAG: hypothetical protein DRQ46_00290 [Gammaproteobacteria bacterium]|nr:MAG: hypothetical protein DRQ46_00290 [Gammaproteobacteria bacterium]